MHTVIKDTHSINEYKQVKGSMEHLAQECFARHKQAVENWTEGEIEKIWFDGSGNLCIEYQSGHWWHYNEKGEWF